MITSWEDLGELLAEYENRLLFLENSTSSQEVHETPVPNKLYQRVQQLEGRLIHQENKLIEHIATPKRKSKY